MRNYIQRIIDAVNGSAQYRNEEILSVNSDAFRDNNISPEQYKFLLQLLMANF